MDNLKNKYPVIDYLFWITFFLFTNPGGILEALGEDTSKAGTIDARDFLFLVIFGLFFIITYVTTIRDINYNKATGYLAVFGIYYFFVFGFIIPELKETPGYSLFLFIKKSRKTLYSLLMFAIVYRFFIRSYIVFFRIYLLSSFVILTLFIVGFITGFEILPVERFNRGFVNIDRIFMVSEGFLPLLIPMGAAAIVFKSDFRWRNVVLINFALMFIVYLLSITRRDIIGTVIYFFIGMILFNYFQHKPIIPIKKIISVGFLFILFGFFISFAFPKYADAGVKGVKEAVHIVQYGETSTGKADVRLGLGKEFMQNLIIDNLYFGTGFDNRWRGTGDKQGYETSDYPFLSAIAMTGIVGILIFLPIYILLVRNILYDIRFIRNNKVDFRSFHFFIFVYLIIYFIYDLLQYMNWFLPVSLSRSIKWYSFFAMYLATRYIFYANWKNKEEKLIST